MSDAVIEFNGPDLRRIGEEVLALMLPPNLQRRWMARMGRMAIAQAQKNINEQKTVDGAAMAPRKRKPPKKRRVYHRNGKTTFKKTYPEMLHDLVKSKFLGVKVSEISATVFFFRNVGYVGYKHQHGTDEVFRRAKAEEAFSANEQERGNREYWKKCTEKHAAVLAANGFPQSEKWIMENFLVGQAFHVLKSMKKEWTVTGTPRPFLGVNGETKYVWGNELMRGIYDRFKAKNHRDLLK